ncbi:hypothetical protein [Paratractidigestivibacter sp.]|uniref:hypothetical protein n=1 Tax=Paratractidigestivibacter sp. TaxID=2847316 RepID=UPI002ACB0AA7|nr:hypothetical protein [Paratractidigestivibacter sp.]
MAMTHDYMDYLNEKVGISPAGSQEELQAAETIADLMRQHDVEPNIEEFDAKTYGGVVPAVLYVLIFVGVFLAGIGVTVLTAIGFVLVAAPVALFVLKYLGRDLLAGVGPTTRSQNVVAFHKGTGPMVMKGTRPIVIVAHYDSPRENPLYATTLADYVPMLWKVSKYSVLICAVCTLFQPLVFLSEPFRRFMWIIGIVAAVPLAILGISTVLEHFSNCTDGVNDNKSGVAAMLGVLENVRPSGLESVHGAESIDQALEAMFAAAEARAQIAAAEDATTNPEIFYAGFNDTLANIEPNEQSAVVADPLAAASDEIRAAAAAEKGPEPVVVYRRGHVEGVRHGADVVKSLGMLPEDCEIEYIEPEPVAVAVPGVSKRGHVEGVRHGADVVKSLGMLPEDCEIEYIEPEPVAVAVPGVSKRGHVEGVRHGADVVKSLGMLPEDCEIEYIEPEPVAVAVPGVSKRGHVEGVRHGADVVKSLGMLPEDCEIEYIEPEPVAVAVPGVSKRAAGVAAGVAAGAGAAVGVAAADVAVGVAAGAGVADAGAVAAAADVADAAAGAGVADAGAVAAAADVADAAAGAGVADAGAVAAAADVADAAAGAGVADAGAVAAAADVADAAAGAGVADASEVAAAADDFDFPAPNQFDAAVGIESADPYGAADDKPTALESIKSLFRMVKSSVTAALKFINSLFRMVKNSVTAAASGIGEKVVAKREEARAAAEQAEGQVAETGDAGVAADFAELGRVDDYEETAETAEFEQVDDPVDAGVAANRVEQVDEPAATDFAELDRVDDYDVADEELSIAEFEQVEDEAQQADAPVIPEGKVIPLNESAESADVTTATTASFSAPAEQTTDIAAPAAPTSAETVVFEPIEEDYAIDPDNTGLDAEDSIDLGDAAPAAVASYPKHAAPDDLEWGKTSFGPQMSNVARRATLLDLPEPSSQGIDPFGTDPDAPKVSVSVDVQITTSYGGAVASQNTSVEDEEFAALVGADSAKTDSDGGLLGRLKGMFGKKETADSGSAPKHGSWKGGAAVRAGLRMIEGDGFDFDDELGFEFDEQYVPTEEDLREEILGLGDDALVCHDIWFVALGASSCDHAGMRAFLAQHRNQVRGAFVINLDSVAAGELTLLSHEGLLVTRRADRRMIRMMTNVVDDLHIPAERAKYDWASTDVTPAMLSSMRGLTVMGTDEAGMRALSHTAADVADNVVPEQAVAVAEAVTELIRRS